ncbi:DUF2927 domain-containing protein [Acuticoccus sp. MNP-M23]|uniref:DUF2927 domain-containing protein n=1 Tax=Acuticoccus sp. MNP-M23 TaxID=3072793 RepID=UPI0028163D45|nr:DUF2927 domain-containing protein [Acuticoccus sp. MNP-M23]WMS44799.1 DUF2927 domain-containing protein [Acuticoccus sp. MNP-M23]
MEDAPGPAGLRKMHGRGLGGWARLTAMIIAVLLALALPAQARHFSDEALIDGFMETVFGAEVGDEADREASRVVKKFTGPVHYHLISTSSVDRRKTLRRFLTQLSDAVENLTLRETPVMEEAQMLIYLTDRADYRATIRASVWEGVNTAFLEGNACSAVLAARRSGIERAHIFLVADEGFLGLSHCMVEEIAQSLGPANDSTALPDSIFNDESTLNVFGVFDWFILNMLYDPRILPGMDEAEVRMILPEVISDVRARLPRALEAHRASQLHDRAR